MKQINDLIVVEIPKDADNIRMGKVLDCPVLHYNHTLHGFVHLPSGYEYEVICKLSELEDKTDEVLLIGNLAQINSPIRYQDYFLLWFDTYNPHKDLLFLKRIKK